MEYIELTFFLRGQILLLLIIKLRLAQLKGYFLRGQAQFFTHEMKSLSFS